MHINSTMDALRGGPCALRVRVAGFLRLLSCTVQQTAMNGTNCYYAYRDRILQAPYKGEFVRRAALEKGDELALGFLMNKNFELRRRIFGDAALGAANLAMIKCAWSVNGAYSQLSWALM